MVTCEVCKKKFSQINIFHLNTHNMTVKDYKNKYPDSKIFSKPQGKTRRKIDFEVDENGCFICTSHAKRKHGYFNYRPNKKPILLHRFIYEQCFGEIEEGLLVRHKCDNRYCINPEHLELGTHLDNSNDMYSRNRQYHKFGTKHPSVKLTEKEVMEIIERLKKGATQRELAKQYGVGTTAIYNIRSGRKWKHLTNIEDFKAVNKEVIP